MRFFVPIGWMILSTAPVAAQSALRRSEMVRVELTSREIIRGKVIDPRSDSLIVSDYTEVLAIPASGILSVATYDRHWMKGGIKGAKIGAVVGGALTVAGLAIDLTYCRKPGSECMGPFTAVGLGAGFWTTGIGAGIGFVTAPGGWTRPKPYLPGK